MIYSLLLDEFFEHDQHARHGCSNYLTGLQDPHSSCYELPFRVADVVDTNLRPWKEQPLYDDYPREFLTVFPKTWYLSTTDNPGPPGRQLIKRRDTVTRDEQYVVWKHKTKLMRLPNLAFTSRQLLQDIGSTLFKDKLHIHLGSSLIWEGDSHITNRDSVERVALKQWVQCRLTVSPFLYTIRTLRVSAEAILTVIHKSWVLGNGNPFSTEFSLTSRHAPLFTIAIEPDGSKPHLIVSTPVKLTKSHKSAIAYIHLKVRQRVRGGQYNGSHIIQVVQLLMIYCDIWAFTTTVDEGSCEDGQGGLGFENEVSVARYVIEPASHSANGIGSDV